MKILVHIGTVIPMPACVFLLIMLLKSSLDLSIGFVGVLSVIRFHTPIKEPEELICLFLAITIRLGCGAGLTFVTSTVFVVVVGLIIHWLACKAVNFGTEYNLHINWSGADITLSDVLNCVGGIALMVALQK